MWRKHMEVALVQWWEGRTTCLQSVKQYKQCLLSFVDGSLQYFFCASDSIYLVTHSLRLLLTKLAAFSLYNLDPNGLGILMTNNANISETQCTISVHLNIECVASSWLLLCLSLMKSFIQCWTYAHVNRATMVTHPHAFHLGISVGRGGALCHWLIVM